MPCKYPHLNLAGTFDEIAVDIPFVFRGDDHVLMACVGFDGQGYQAGLARSDDLSCILYDAQNVAVLSATSTPRYREADRTKRAALRSRAPNPGS